MGKRFFLLLFLLSFWVFFFNLLSHPPNTFISSIIFSIWSLFLPPAVLFTPHCFLYLRMLSLPLPSKYLLSFSFTFIPFVSYFNFFLSFAFFWHFFSSFPFSSFPFRAINSNHLVIWSIPALHYPTLWYPYIFHAFIKHKLSSNELRLYPYSPLLSTITIDTLAPLYTRNQTVLGSIPNKRWMQLIRSSYNKRDTVAFSVILSKELFFNHLTPGKATNLLRCKYLLNAEEYKNKHY